MLVLSRQKDQSIIIGEKVGEDGKYKQLAKIEVVDIRGDKVRLGIIAPDGYPIHREEVWNAVIKEREESDED